MPRDKVCLVIIKTGARDLPDLRDVLEEMTELTESAQGIVVASLTACKSGYMDDIETIAALAALAQATRLNTFRLLVSREPDGVPAGELARVMDVPQNTMSAHWASSRGRAW